MFTVLFWLSIVFFSCFLILVLVLRRQGVIDEAGDDYLNIFVEHRSADGATEEYAAPIRSALLNIGEISLSDMEELKPGLDDRSFSLIREGKTVYFADKDANRRRKVKSGETFAVDKNISINITGGWNG